jgi:hypothetical protein
MSYIYLPDGSGSVISLSTLPYYTATKEVISIISVLVIRWQEPPLAIEKTFYHHLLT